MIPFAIAFVLWTVLVYGLGFLRGFRVVQARAERQLVTRRDPS